jgi:F0F1-type ATP synthase membrane subunit a
LGFVFFLVVFFFFFFLLFFFFLGFSGTYFLFSSFLRELVVVFSYGRRIFLRRFFSFFLFVFMLFCCFGGYFCYSVCLCGMFEFTFFFSLVCWFTTFLLFLRGEKFSIYMRKGGDSFLKTFIMFLIEVVREFSRPIALTVRLTVNILVGHMVSLVFYVLLESFLGNFFVFLTLFAIFIECFVFFIQSYIFSRLVFLYLNE